MTSSAHPKSMSQSAMMAMRLVSKVSFISITVTQISHFSRESIYTISVGIFHRVSFCYFSHESIRGNDTKKYQKREQDIGKTLRKIPRRFIEPDKEDDISDYRCHCIDKEVGDATTETTETLTWEKIPHDGISPYPKDSENECEDEEGSERVFH